MSNSFLPKEGKTNLLNLAIDLYNCFFIVLHFWDVSKLQNKLKLFVKVNSKLNPSSIRMGIFVTKLLEWICYLLLLVWFY